MRTRKILGVGLGVLMLSITAFAQEISWEIKLHNSANTTILEREVNAYVEDGYVPVGLNYDDSELYILYVEDSGFAMSAWSLEWYEDRTSIGNGITAKMEGGSIPTGIAYTGDMFYVLYVRTESSADAWQLIPSGADLQSVQQEIQPYIDQGYVPTGITALGDEYWTLLLHVPDTTVQSWRLETYAVGTHADAINANIEQGYLPWGLMYDASAGEIDILYVGF